MTQLYFVGDVHGRWDLVYPRLACSPPGVVVMVGDLGIDHDMPWAKAVAPIKAAGHRVRWIPGNHDINSVALDSLWSPGAPECFHRDVIAAGDLKIAGLGGVFRSRVWNPDTGTPSRTRRAVLQPLPNMSHRDTIFEEDVRQFEGQRADILVCHEAPTPHRYGFAAIAKLAAELRGRLVVHGHHHRSEEYRTEAGIRVHSLGLAEVWAMPGDYMQEGGEV